MPTVLIATKNEEDNIADILSQISYPVLVVDDSNDRTPDIARSFSDVEVISGANMGIAHAYMTGMTYLRPTTDRVVQMDAGGTHDPADIERILDLKADLVIGVREFEYKGVRTLISFAARFLVNNFVFTDRGYLGTRTHVSDVTSGFRVWSPELLNSLDFNRVRSKGFAFQIELLYQAYKQDASIKPFPIDYELTNTTLKIWMLLEAIWITLELILS